MDIKILCRISAATPEVITIHDFFKPAPGVFIVHIHTKKDIMHAMNYRAHIKWVTQNVDRPDIN